MGGCKLEKWVGGGGGGAIVRDGAFIRFVVRNHRQWDSLYTAC